MAYVLVKGLPEHSWRSVHSSTKRLSLNFIPRYVDDYNLFYELVWLVNVWTRNADIN